MPPRAVGRGGRSQNAASSSSSKARGGEKRAQDGAENQIIDDDSSTSQGTERLYSQTNPLILDEDEEDEMALRSPIKPVLAPRVETKKAAASSSSSGDSQPESRAKKTTRAKTDNKKGTASSSSSAKSSKASKVSRNVLGSAKAANESVAEGVTGMEEEGAPPKPKRGKSKVSAQQQKKQAAVAESSDEDPAMQRAQPRSASGVSMPEEQVQTFLNGFDLEASNRVQRLKDHLAVTLESAKTQMSILLSRLPVSARSLPLQEFLDSYGTEVKSALHRAGKQAGGLDDDDGWEEMKRKRAREQDEEAGRKGKAAKRNNANAKNASSSPSKGPALHTARAARNNRSTTAQSAPTYASPTRSSTMKAPSASTFSPALDLPPRPGNTAATAKTPAKVTAKTGRPSRVAKIGEMVQMLSLNGSPITGVIGPDGRFRTFAQADEGEDEEQQREEHENGLPSGSLSKGHDAGTPLTRAAASSTAAALRQLSASSSSQPQMPSSPAPVSRSGIHLHSSSAIVFDDDVDRPQSRQGLAPSSVNPPQNGAGGQYVSGALTAAPTHSGASSAVTSFNDELPDEEAEMRRFIAEEEARRKATKLLSTKSSASRLKNAYSALTHSSSSAPPSSSPVRGQARQQPPASPLSRQQQNTLGRSSSSVRSSPGKAFASSIGSHRFKPGHNNNMAHPVAPPASSSPASKSSAAASGGNKPPNHRLSFVNARGETIDLASVRDEDIPQDQKASLMGLFSRWRRDVASPKKK